MQHEVIKFSFSLSDRVLEAYFTGMLYAGYHFTQTRPDWSNRLVELATYSVAWPINIAEGIYSRVCESLNYSV